MVFIVDYFYKIRVYNVYLQVYILRIFFYRYKQFTGNNLVLRFLLQKRHIKNPH